jgi:hypothetical protein
MSDNDRSDFITTSFANPGTTDTFGWDTVYAVKAPIVNAALRKHFGEQGDLASRLAFDQSLAGGNRMSGQFRTWQLASGGSGTKLMLDLPIRSGAATVNGFGLEGRVIDLSGATIRAEVTLGFHHVDEPSAAGDKDAVSKVTAALKINTDRSAPGAGSASTIREHAAQQENGTSTEPVLVTGIRDFSPDNVPKELHSLVGGVIQVLATKWLSQNLSMFDYVFLSVDVAETAAYGEWDWIKPTYVGFAFAEPLDANGAPVGIDDAVFAILANVGKDPRQGGMPSVSINAIPNNARVNAGFLIRPELIIEKIFKPNLPKLFENASYSDFGISTDGLSISNIKPLHLKLEMDPTWYRFARFCDATIPESNLTVAMNRTTVEQSFTNLSFPYGYQNELTVQMALTSYSKMGLDGNNNFTMHIDKTTTSTLTVQPDASKIAWQALEGLAINLVMMVALCYVPGGGAIAEAEGAALGTTEVEITSAESQVVKELEGSIGEGMTAPVTKSLTVERAESTVGAAEIGSETAQTAMAEMKQPGTWSWKGLQQKFTFKLWAMVVAQIAGEVYQNLSNVDIIRAYGNSPTEMPTLQHFLSDCVAPARWTNLGDQKLLCAGLNGAFVMGFEVPVTGPSV